MKALLSGIKRSADICRYFYRFACGKKPSYPLWVCVNIILTSLLPFIAMLLPKYIIDELTGSRDLKCLVILTAVLVGGTFVMKNLILLIQEHRKVQEDDIARALELAMSKKAMTVKFECTETEAALSARQKAETGMSWYSGGIKGMSECLVKIGTGFCVIFGVIFLVVRISPLLLLLSLIAVSVNAVCTSGINHAAQEVFEKTPAINKFYSYIYTKISGREYAKELRLYDAGELVEKKAVENAKELNKMDNECAKKQFGFGLAASIASAAGYGISYGYLGILALKGKISVSEFVMCITAMEVFTNDCLIAVITNLQQLIMKCNFMGAFIEYMKLEDEQDDASLKPEEEAFDGIEFEHVSFMYPGRSEYILKDINLKIGRGESISLVGRNGSGKSTLVKLLCRLYDVTEGSIKICGRDIREYSYEEYIRLLSVVFQDFKLFGYSLDENIKLGNINREDKPDTVYGLSGIDGWVDSLKKKGDTMLYKEFDEAGVEPSGGQAQKLAIARAVYRDSPVVILDEPTASLDPVAEYEIYSRFNELIKNKTAVYISHRLSSCRFCDRIVVLDDHTIRETGSHNELLKMKGVYEEMFKSQAKWYEEQPGY